MNEKASELNNNNEKYINADYIRGVFESDDRQKINKIAEFHNLSKEQVKLFTYYAKMRKSVVDPLRQEVDRRKRKDSLATEEELTLGLYLEEIEPQVRNAVIKMNKKGYATNYSGFHNFDSQIIKFNTEEKVDIFLEQIEKKYKDKGIKIEINPGSIEINFSQKISLEEIKKIWDEIADALPDLGDTSKDNNSIKRFKEIQRQIRAGERKNYYE